MVAQLNHSVQQGGLPVGSDRGKPSQLHCSGGESAGGEDDVVEVGVGGVLKQRHGATLSLR